VRFYAHPLSQTQVLALTNVSFQESRAGMSTDQLPPPVLDITEKTLTGPASLEAQLVGRSEIYKVGRRMASEFPWLGSGPGTFRPTFQVHRREAQIQPQWYAHNDWLETRITFGRVGSVLVFSALALAGLPTLIHRGLGFRGVFIALFAAALGGCLLHARFDYPFQVHSILFVFLALVAVGTVLSGRK